MTALEISPVNLMPFFNNGQKKEWFTLLIYKSIYYCLWLKKRSDFVIGPVIVILRSLAVDV